MTEPIKSGDTLFYQSTNFRKEWEPKPVIINKVGRKWATLVDGHSDTRVDRTTLELNGRRAWGRLWRSKEEWLEAKAADERQRDDSQIWDALRRWFTNSWNRPKDLHADSMRAAAELLGAELEKSK